jgi:hypothetical protein
MIDKTLSDILETEQRIAISLSVCYRVRLFCPDRIAYHSGIGVHQFSFFSSSERVSAPDRLSLVARRSVPDRFSSSPMVVSPLVAENHAGWGAA